MRPQSRFRPDLRLSQGLATLTSAGRLSAVGLRSRGIAAEAHEGVALKVDNQGDVHVAGTGAHGMRLTSAGGNIALTSRGAITSVQAVYVPADDPTDPAPATAFAHLDAFIYLERRI